MQSRPMNIWVRGLAAGVVLLAGIEDLIHEAYAMTLNLDRGRAWWRASND